MDYFTLVRKKFGKSNLRKKASKAKIDSIKVFFNVENIKFHLMLEFEQMR